MKGITKVIGRLLWKVNRTPVNTNIEYSLYIRHGGPVVFNPNTIIGDNCNFSINRFIVVLDRLIR